MCVWVGVGIPFQLSQAPGIGEEASLSEDSWRKESFPGGAVWEESLNPQTWRIYLGGPQINAKDTEKSLLFYNCYTRSLKAASGHVFPFGRFSLFTIAFFPCIRTVTRSRCLLTFWFVSAHKNTLAVTDNLKRCRRVFKSISVAIIHGR